MVELAHSFPLAESCLLCTSAVSLCTTPEDASPFFGKEKPQLRTARPTSLDLYIRPYRYIREDCLSHMEDLWSAAHSRPMLACADAVWVGGDNGPGYAITEFKLQHLVWRLARSLGWC